jgi:collagenase-like PrtC family protease
VAGPHLNVYNPQSLSLVAELGATRWVAPLEATRALVAGVCAARPLGVEAEVFVHGRMPLAFSARCFTARRFNRQKEDCGYVCMDYPDGMALDTREGRPFLAANGIQTQSAGVYCLVDEMKDLEQAGVGILRVSPQSKGTFDVVQILRDVSDERSNAGEARKALAALSPGALWNGFWHGRSGMEASA